MGERKTGQTYLKEREKGKHGEKETRIRMKEEEEEGRKKTGK